MGRISVMIVDDERLAVDDLVAMVDWQAEGFEIVATAVNGRQALQKFHELRPQVIFADIKMPHMDGIELIQRIRAVDLTPKIILLTAYKDFSYAQTAIQCGITDYILKSDISTGTVRQTLHKLRGLIESESSARLMLDEKRIADFFRSEEEDGSGATLFDTPYHCLIVEQDLPIDISGENMADPDIHLSAERVAAILAERAEGVAVVAQSAIRREQVLVLLSIPDTSLHAVQGKLHHCASTLLTALRGNAHSFTAYTHQTPLSLRKLRAFYNANRSCFRAKYLLGTGRVYELMGATATADREDIFLDDELVGELVANLNAAALREYVDRLFARVRETQSYLSLYYVSRNLYDLLKLHNKALPEHLGRLDLSADAHSGSWYSAESIHQWFTERFAALVETRRRTQAEQYSKAVRKAMHTIRSNYASSDLTVNVIAADVHLSAGHLCALFKKETGKTIKDFTTEVRIAAAKKLLEQSDSKVYEVSEAVGYRTSQYFSQVFFKLTGQYPAEYQRGGGKRGAS